MIGRILFLSAAAFVAYRYIGHSNKKARAIKAKADLQEILPPEPPPVDSSAQLLPAEQTRSIAAESDPGR